MAHGVAAAPTGLTIEHMPWTFGMFTEEPKIEEGMMVLSDKPGLGIEVNMDALQRFKQD